MSTTQSHDAVSIASAIYLAARTALRDAELAVIEKTGHCEEMRKRYELEVALASDRNLTDVEAKKHTDKSDAAIRELMEKFKSGDSRKTGVGNPILPYPGDLLNHDEVSA